MIQAAVNFLRQGRMADAESLCRRLLHERPNDFDALHLLGVIAAQTARGEWAVELFQHAIRRRSDVPSVYNNLGNVLRDLKRGEEAVVQYSRALALRRDFAEAYLGRSAVLLDLRRPAQSLVDAEAAVALHPGSAEAHLNRGAALRDLKRSEEALASLNTALTLEPALAAAFLTRGFVLLDLNDPAAAATSFESALRLNSQDARAHCGRAAALLGLNLPAQALESSDRAITLNPTDAAAHANRAAAMQRLGRSAEALRSCETAIALEPSLAAAHNVRAAALIDLLQPEEALASADQAIAIQPDYALAYVNRAGALLDLQRAAEAIESADRAIVLQPRLAAAHINRGDALHASMRVAEALVSLERAVSLDPDSAEAHFNQAHCYLQLGQYQPGWQLYEWRRNIGRQAARMESWPAWTGKEAIAGKVILLHSEQGLGDTVQFLRLAKLVEKLGARVVLSIQRDLCGLARSLGSSFEIIEEGSQRNDIDYQCALASVPHALNLSLEQIPAAVPYLSADPERVARWRRSLGEHGYKVGICWQGSRNKIDLGRSIPVAYFAELAQIPGVRLISVQKGYGIDQLAALPPHLKVEAPADGVGPEALQELAALMANLDLVITSDTLIAHLAGALARPTWIALKYVPDWRWMLEREDSPWYPTARLFRQASAGDWAGVFQRIREALLNLLGQVQLARQNAAAAAEYFEKVVTLMPRDAASWRRLGGAYLESGNFPRAAESLRASLALDPTSTRAHNNLGRALFLGCDRSGARESYQRALSLDPDYGLAHLNLGVLLLSSGEAAEALRHIERCLATNPDLPEVWVAHADAMSRLNRRDLALSSADRALGLSPRLAAAHYIRGKALYELKRFAEALECCDRALALRPNDDQTHFGRGRTLFALGETAEAIEAFKSALRINADHHSARWSLAVAAVPVLNESIEEIDRSRAAFLGALKDLEDHLDQHGCDDATQMVGVSNPFFLAYHPRNNRELMSRYGRICAGLMGDWQRAHGLHHPSPRVRAKLRIGIVSAQIRQHSVFTAITRGWLTMLPRERFEICVFYLEDFIDAQTERARARVDHFEQGTGTVESWATSILKQKPDVLIYPEIGMTAIAVQLASMRLAPVQCVSWGHPETSGLPTVDYYLSARNFESIDAAAHYSEKLICLPNLGSYYEPEEVAAITTPASSEMKADESGPNLICAGASFKYMPQHDGVFVEIARRLGRCRFHFFGAEDAIAKRLLSRLSRAFEASGLDSSRFLVLRPWAAQSEFHAMMRAADLMLDTIGFSGFNTVMQALECNLPVVTQRGEFMRGRFGSGILERLGISELIARDPAEYADTVVRLMADEELRRRIRWHIADRRYVLYRDAEAVAGLEEFLLGLGT